MRRMKLILDTNAVLDLLHWQDERMAPLAAAIAAGRVQLLSDAPALAELERVLAYPRLGIAASQAGALLAAYQARLTLVPAPGEEATPALLPRCRDADDQKFLELAQRAGADYLITRDRDLLRLAGSRRRPLAFVIATPEAAWQKMLTAMQV